MCGRYYIEIEEEELREIVFEAERNARGLPEQPVFGGGEIFPGATVPVVTGHGAVFMKWGFPSITSGRPSHINTKSETALTLPTFREAMRHRRCLVPATAYYEWRDTGGKKKERYEFFTPERSPFYMAGVYSVRGEFSILTRAATEAFSHIHERMPAVISRPELRRWLLDAPSAVERAYVEFKFRNMNAAECGKRGEAGDTRRNNGGQMSFFV